MPYTIASEPEFNRFSISAIDFESAARFAEEAQKYPANSTAYEALLFAAIVCYYRPFSPNEKKGVTSATANLDIDSLIVLSPDEKQLHDECKLLRNKALAHSEHSVNPTQINASRDVVVSKPFSLFTRAPDVSKLLDLIKKVARECDRARGSYMIAQNR